MRDTDELMRDIMSRGSVVKRRRTVHRQQIVYGICAFASALLLLITAAYLPKINEAASESVEQHYGSLILRTPYMGYVVIGFLAFACGVFVTLMVCSKMLVKRDKSE